MAWVLIAAAVVSVGATVAWRALAGGAGFIAHTVSTEVFTSGLDVGRVLRESIAGNPALRMLAPVTRVEVDAARRRVSVSILGIIRARAVHRGALGTVLVGRAATEPVVVTAVPRHDTTPDPFPALSAPPVDLATPALHRAVDRAFDVDAERRRTRAVVVVHRDRVVAERYAEGITAETALPAYSVAKSVTNAMLGILARQGRIAVDQPAPVAEWSGTGDPRSAITIDHLMRMTSGLSTTETNTGLDDVTRIVYRSDDMARESRRARLKHRPGSHYYYSSGNTLVLSSIIRDLVGPDPVSTARWADAELFGRLNMRHTTLEFDAHGTPIGSTYVIASARDLARLGLLYLHDGELSDGRVLPAGWVDYSTRQTLDSEYGAGWRPVASPAARTRFGMEGVPHDAYLAVGFLGQYIVVIPSAELVIVRMGASHGEIGKADAIGELVRDVIAAVSAAPQAAAPDPRGTAGQD